MTFRRKVASQQSTVPCPARPPPLVPLPTVRLHQPLQLGTDSRGAVTLHPTHPKNLKSQEPSIKLVGPVSTARALADWVRVSCQRTTQHLLGPGVQLSVYACVYETGSGLRPGGAAAEKCLPVLPTLSWEAAFLLEAEQPLKGGREGGRDVEIFSPETRAQTTFLCLYGHIL